MNLFPFRMVHGVDGVYVGNTPAIDRLGIPALTMNDGPQGFRCNEFPGTTTAFPAAINIASTFDPDSAFLWGQVFLLLTFSKCD
jgi:beta-glucosidase